MLQFFDNLPDPWGTIAKSIVGVIGAIIAIFTSMKMFAIVPQGHKAMKTRFGRVVRHRDGTVREYDPGVMWLVPFFGGCELIDVREQHRDLGEITVEQGMYCLRVASLHLVVRVIDLYSFRYVINDPLAVINALARQECQRLLRASTDAIQLGVGHFSDDFTAICTSYGVEVLRLIVDNDVPDSRMALAGAVAATRCDPALGAIADSITP